MNKKIIAFIGGLMVAVAVYAAEQRFTIAATGIGQGPDRETAKQNSEADASAKLICGGELENVQPSTNCQDIGGAIGGSAQDNPSRWSCETLTKAVCVLHRDADQTIRIIR